MTTDALVELIDESLNVDIEEISNTERSENGLIITTNDGSKFIIIINKMPRKLIINMT